MLHQAAQRGRERAQGKPSSHSEATSHVVDYERKQVTVKFGKRVTAGDIEKYVSALTANPAFHADFSEIVDLTEVEQMDLQAEDFIRLADQVDPFSPAAKRAFVVKTTSQNHAARMHKILRTHRTIEIFRSVEDAERWIYS